MSANKTQVFNQILTILTKVTKLKPSQKKNVKAEDRIRKYVPVIDAMNLALAISNEFDRVDINDVLNKLFDDINTLKELRDYVLEVYE